MHHVTLQDHIVSDIILLVLRKEFKENEWGEAFCGIVTKQSFMETMLLFCS
jgi:hypothetical protein